MKYFNNTLKKTAKCNDGIYNFLHKATREAQVQFVVSSAQLTYNILRSARFVQVARTDILNVRDEKNFLQHYEHYKLETY